MNVRNTKATIVLALAIAAGSSFTADQQPADFQSLYDQHHWFALRDAVEQGKPSQFYRGAVEAAFHRSQQARKDLEAVIRAHPHDHDALEAHSLLAGLYLRTGGYREALLQTNALLAEKSDAEDARNVRSVFRVLSQTPDQAVIRMKPSTVRMQIEDGSLFLRPQSMILPSNMPLTPTPPFRCSANQKPSV